MIGCKLNHTNTRFSHDPKKGLIEILFGGVLARIDQNVSSTDRSHRQNFNVSSPFELVDLRHRINQTVGPFYGTSASAVAVRLKGVGAEGFFRTD